MEKITEYLIKPTLSEKGIVKVWKVLGILEHAFGDGKRLSCSKTVDAVSGLFQNIPISGYLAMNMGGIPQMNDAVGGVEVTVQQDISFPKAGVNLKKGQKVTLNGTQAYYYLHGRDTEEYDSATKRLQRRTVYCCLYG